MCRLMYLPRGARPSKRVLKNWLVSLDESFGGHGCGLASHGKVRKGVAFTSRAAAALISKSKGPVLWHTRRVSCGPRSDELCHPFPTANGSFLAHNGHWTKGAFTASMLAGSWSDSAVAARYIQLYGWAKFTEHCEAGVWLHMTPEGVEVHYMSGDLWVEEKTGALCSEPCKGWGVWNKASFGTYKVGERVPAREASKPNLERLLVGYENKKDLLWDRMGLPRLQS